MGMKKQMSLEKAWYSDAGLELISNRNLVDLYREELLEIARRKVNATEVLGEGIHRNMTKQGIIHVRHKCGGRESVISPMWLHYLLDGSL